MNADNYPLTIKDKFLSLFNIPVGELPHDNNYIGVKRET